MNNTHKKGPLNLNTIDINLPISTLINGKSKYLAVFILQVIYGNILNINLKYYIKFIYFT